MKNQRSGVIITFHCTPNYGATLQAYAMKSIFNNHFTSISILDYRPQQLMKPYKYFNLDYLNGFVSSCLNLPTNLIKYRKFYSFRKHNMNLTKRFNKQEEIDFSTDIIILGSDQIWNTDIFGEIDGTYYGEIGRAKWIISYAASIGKDQLTNAEKKFYSKKLQNIKHIALREQSAKEILSDEVGQEMKVVLDPTLLVSSEEWGRIASRRSLKYDYVLIYSLNGYNETYETAYNVAKERNIKVVEVLGRNIDFKSKRSHKVLPCEGPEDFLALFRDAKYISTDSFHGTVFSIIFRKDFSTIPHKTRGSRMIDLLKKLNLETRLVSFNVTSCFDSVDWNEVEPFLSREIQVSQAYIESIQY